ncbi:T6SS phospholipase effector Tle1-like catalytic domain-containing protein [Pseudomarimonas arenosa]|uniref:DUF2235 domain-containing protein n=1 Tax=Pseudomarimonas arenosa TaxID=2774145 RepID=A0AAW3ZP99_9GAMM|nr:DUF2235 domain-containing protein [Pseudomarimonas arenosa]MBD8526469.1 DUF2235 domain-containing protein [Pseudomarimonas arenosa]
MSRRLIICIDGTNNYPNSGYTNIQRLFRMLARDDTQLTYYQPGVGTIEPGTVTSRIGRKLMMAVDGASAWLMQQHVTSAYRFLMNHYREGDEICCFGFSRGAFSVRVLAGMISKVGVLHPGFDPMIRFAWDTYRTPGNRDVARRFRAHYGRYVSRIGFVGLFDSVSAVGLPWVPRYFPRTAHNPRVKTVRHALALDERRVMFVQNRWREDEAALRSTDVQQVWFAGVHSDVGGGYAEPEAGLSLIPLAWMVREARAAGLRFRPRVSRHLLGTELDSQARFVEQLSERHALAPAHDELEARWWWKAIEPLPIPRRRPIDADRWETVWIRNRGAARKPGPELKIHNSVLRRQQAGYQPAIELQQPHYVE